MLYLNQISQKKEDKYVLNFNGVNQRAFSNGGVGQSATDFNQLTFFLRIKPTVIVGDMGIFREGTDRTNPVHLFTLRSGIFNSYKPGAYIPYVAVPINEWLNISVTKDHLLNEEKVYINGDYIGVRVIGAKESRSAQYDLGINAGRFKGQMQEVSIIKRVKTIAEIEADHAANTQLGDNSEFNFRLKLDYKQDGTGNIPTLATTTVTDTAQNIPLTLLNYPNPLVLGTDLIKL